MKHSLSHAIRFFLALFLCVSAVANAHKNEHDDGVQAAPSAPAAVDKLSVINDLYVKSVKPIFDRKCADCHGVTKRFPKYYSIPGIRQYMDSDIREAKEHLDISHDFPFGGHGDPKKDLKAIRESITKREMPPLLYLLMHRENNLTPEEEKTILRWVDEGEEILVP